MDIEHAITAAKAQWSEWSRSLTFNPYSYDHHVVIPDEIALSLTDVRTYDKTGCGIPITVSKLIHHGTFAEQEYRGSGVLHIPDLKHIIPNIFNEPDAQNALEQTAQTLFHSSVRDIKGLRIWALTFGNIDQILMCETQLRENKGYFIIYLAKGPEGTHYAQISHDDFKLLQLASDAFSDILTPSARKTFRITRPVAEGHVIFRGKHHPLRTAAFVPYGEINAGFKILGSLEHPHQIYPYYNYAVPFTAQMEKTNDTNELDALIRLIHDHPKVSIEYMPTVQPHKPEEAINIYKKQQEHMFLTMALLYRTLHIVPSEHMIQAGDVMGILNNDGGIMTNLITFRGGAMIPENWRAFKEWMRRKQEPMPPFGNHRAFPVYSDLTDKDMQRIIESIEGLLR